ncbi:peptidase M48 [Chitinispirillum alkaliphilum]|nr:peptidase M48 [Chitinispirillum alkaliphilum]
MSLTLTMDFFGHQDEARRKTTLLVWYFTAAVLMIIAGIYFVVAGLMVYYEAIDSLIHPLLLLSTSAITLSVILSGSLYKISSLRKGGAVVARMMGAEVVSLDTENFEERKLMNVVEEMSIASGFPMPEVYVMDDSAINAFAAGHSQDDAVICVTRGCMEQLSRDELQGVVAHEFSHIINGDVLINIRLIGVLHGILMIGLFGKYLFTSSYSSVMFSLRTSSYSSSSSDSSRFNSLKKKKEAFVTLLAGLAIMALGYFGVFFGSLIKAAISRNREYLADASAVQFTRSPDGISGALKKIGGVKGSSEIKSFHASEVSHLFFGNGIKRPFLKAMATHPPLIERIKRIEPQFKGYGNSDLDQTAPSGGDSLGVNVSGFVGSAPVREYNPGNIVESVGRPTADHLSYASNFLKSLPDEIHTACQQAEDAMALIFSVLISEQADVAEKQMATIQQEAGVEVLSKVETLLPQIQMLERKSYIPVSELALGGLRSMTEQQYSMFISVIGKLIEADNRVSIFELALRQMITRKLSHRFVTLKRPKVAYRSIPSVKKHLSLLISTLAWSGTDNSSEAQAAFDAGISEVQEGSQFSLQPQNTLGTEQLEVSLKELDKASASIKKHILKAAVAVVAHDGKIGVDQAELIRAVAEYLHCPVPPVLVNVAETATAS